METMQVLMQLWAQSSNGFISARAINRAFGADQAFAAYSLLLDQSLIELDSYLVTLDGANNAA